MNWCYYYYYCRFDLVSGGVYVGVGAAGDGDGCDRGGDDDDADAGHWFGVLRLIVAGCDAILRRDSLADWQCSSYCCCCYPDR